MILTLMKSIFHILLFMTFAFSLNGQTQIVLEKGTVTYLSSRNVYIKFATTKNINIGDTLFIKQNEDLIPALVVTNKSSTSSVCTPLISEKMKVSDEVFAKSILKKEKTKGKEIKEEELPMVENEIAMDETINSNEENIIEEEIFKQKIKGRISATSYSNFSDYKTTHRMRYAFSPGKLSLKKLLHLERLLL